MKRKNPVDSSSHRDPYKPARRPASADRPGPRGRAAEGASQRPAYGRSRFGDDEARPAYRPRSGDSGGFTVVLDPDVARVFRGAASVNKALRLVMQLNQVVQGPPHRAGAPRQRSEAEGGRRYAASSARFNDDDEQ